MNQTLPVAATDSEPLNAVAALRAELGLTLAEMGERVGLSKSQMHEVERTARASLPVALRIEALSAEADGARIDAADLSEDVKAARAALVAATDHASGDSREGVQDHG